MKSKIIATALALATTVLTPVQPAQAQFAVIDVKAIAQAVQQVNQGLQQITQLKAQLSAQQNMLAKLGSDISPQLSSILGDATSVMKSASGIGYGAKSLTSQLSSIYPKNMIGSTLAQITAAQTNWTNRSADTQREAMEAQNAIVASQSATQTSVSGAISASQTAVGQTAALQATNQLLGALSTQLTGLQTLLLTQMRAVQTAQAEQVAEHSAAAATMSNATQTTTYSDATGRKW